MESFQLIKYIRKIREGFISHYRNVHTKDHNLVLRVFHQVKICLQPFHLRIGECKSDIDTIASGSFDLHVVHHDDMRLAYVQRIVCRSEIIHERLLRYVCSCNVVRK